MGQLTYRGGQSRAYFIALAASLGYAITIKEFCQFQVGTAHVGQRVYGESWVFTWRINAPEVMVRSFMVGQSLVGERLRSWGNLLLECAMLRVKPSHTHLFFAYGPREILDEVGDFILDEDGNALFDSANE